MLSSKELQKAKRDFGRLTIGLTLAALLAFPTTKIYARLTSGKTEKGAIAKDYTLGFKQVSYFMSNDKSECYLEIKDPFMTKNHKKLIDNNCNFHIEERLCNGSITRTPAREPYFKRIDKEYAEKLENYSLKERVEGYLED